MRTLRTGAYGTRVRASIAAEESVADARRLPRRGCCVPLPQDPCRCPTLASVVAWPQAELLASLHEHHEALADDLDDLEDELGVAKLQLSQTLLQLAENVS